MNFSSIFFLIFLLSGCSSAGIGYLTEQGIGQLRLQWDGVDNKEVLKNGKIPEEVKKKISLIDQYKKFFYDFFRQPSSSIYSKTTILDSEAVSYLVIASPHNKIEPYQFKFPFVGEFPYIGFFKKDSAAEYAQKLREEENLVTWIRPVFAYSTLGFFEDRILSSFFKFNNVELAELIFHELFHTVFFVKNEVDFNENLANYFGKQLLKEYFKNNEELILFFENERKIELRNKKIVDTISILNEEFSKLGGFLTPSRADDLTSRFVDDIFIPEVIKYCDEIKLEEEHCKMNQSWNQAAFAAFLTYEKEQDFIEVLHSKLSLNLKDFLSWLNREYQSFASLNLEISFSDYLKSKVGT